VDAVLEELKNLDMLNPATWEPDKYQAWCEHCRKYSLEDEACYQKPKKQPSWRL
jgi:hypothetical protein